MSTVNKLEFLSDIRNRKTIIIEAVVFQLLWFACVLGDTWVWVTAGWTLVHFCIEYTHCLLFSKRALRTRLGIGRTGRHVVLF